MAGMKSSQTQIYRQIEKSEEDILNFGPEDVDIRRMNRSLEVQERERNN